MSVRLPQRLRSRLEAWAREGYPEESCGLLLGRHDGELVRVERVTRARNLNTARARDRYELDPRDWLATDERARAAGLEIVGVWHTHPDHPARPSETDRAQAWEAWSYLILSVGRGGVADLRSWRLAGAEFVPEEVTA
jgi:proteasome lid subunit RPN8/RPN11